MSKGFEGFNLAQFVSMVCMLQPRLRPSLFCTSSRHCWKRFDCFFFYFVASRHENDRSLLLEADNDTLVYSEYHEYHTVFPPWKRQRPKS